MSKEGHDPLLGVRLQLKDAKWKGRPGKTRRDKESGAWANRLANRASRALENKRGAGKK